ncbi:MAG TPA: NAD(P)/FAD-dependent oxidoreductase [Gemmataceae bacterium]|nr:NAD(P)/FAD-dependent oxidoreductase [Gemmataceae bacterium]
MARERYDAVVVGSGPNGMAAAIALARAGRSVLVLEANATLGGGARSAELTLPGFVHDICSAIHPLGAASPFFKTLPLDKHGLEWIDPLAPLAHPFDDGTAAILERDLEATAASLGRDGDAYRQLFGSLVRHADDLFTDALAPLKIPRHPLLLSRFGLRAIQSARGLAERWFNSEKAKGLFAGCAAHAIIPFERPLSAAVGLMLMIAGHSAGWPLPRGGSQTITDALASYFRSLGGEFEVERRVRSFTDLPQARSVLFDVSPRNLEAICGDRLPPRYRRQLLRFRHGPAVFKIDYALDGPIPWKAAECRRAGTVHLGGTLEEMAEAERAIWEGRHPERPYVLIAQQSLFDSMRAPAGKHTCWAYCHVPQGSTIDMTSAIEDQLERFAPGFRDLALAKHITTPADFERGNANYIGGDISGGVLDLWQTFTRPVIRVNPYTTPNRSIYICSASTPPGAGVHGMCGYWAAQAALRRM